MSERDAAWMARIMARFSDAHVRAMVEQSRMEPGLTRELTRILIGRRDKILRRYLTRLSPLAWPKVRVQKGRADLCLEDLGVLARVADPKTRAYSARAWLTEDLEPALLHAPVRERGRFACVALPEVPGAAADKPAYLIVDVTARSLDQAPGPLRVHLYHLGGTDFRVVGLERPVDQDAPG